jgi:ABC-type sugar transport system ATPase subunit
MLAGFEEPTEGELYLDGQPLKGVPPHKRPVNMMFQSYALFPHMSVADNIAFGLKQDGMAKGEIDERVEQMLKLVKLEEFAAASRTSSPAASASAWRWPARSPSGPSCCCSTNRSARSTRSCARKPSSS